MKKIKILTFHRAVNYGALLQTYALYQSVKKYNEEVEILDYRCPNIENYYYRIFAKEKTVQEILKSILFVRKQRKRNQKFEKFREKYLKLADASVLERVEAETDRFLVGSDQVWNYGCTGGDTTYLLDFVKEKKKKYSYAVSFGKMTRSEEEKMKLLEYLKNFECFSMREEKGRKWIATHLGKESRLDLDPTLLLSCEEWKKISVVPKEKNYILIYSVNLPDKILEIGRRIAKEMGKKLIVITLNNKYYAKKTEKNESEASIEEFLGWFLMADFIITNSFHGTVFSILFEKEFFTLENEKTGLDNSRLQTLLERTGLLERLKKEIRETDFQKKIDYKTVKTKQKEMRQDSLSYLKEVCQ